MTVPAKQAFPAEFTIHGESFRFEKILKRDLFSTNILYRGPRANGQVLKISDFRVPLGVLLRPLAVLLARREYCMYQRLAGISGIPALGPRYGLRGFFHEYVEGVTLFQLPKGHPLPEAFWLSLHQTLENIHQRGIVHMDLHKLANIVITDSGSACILDFQLSLPIFGRSRWTCTPIIMLFEHLKREDFYHVYKHKRRFQQEMMSEKELRFAQRSLANERFFRYVGEPYRKIKRLIYPKGSNETIWYRWKERRDRSHEVP